MSNTTNTKSFWFGNIADDHDGHKGTGYTPEAAQKALERAQQDEVPYAEHHVILGNITTSDKPLK